MADNITFIYDGEGRRVGITESHGVSILTNKRFVWCMGKLCQERDSSGVTVTKQFFRRGERIGTTNYYFSKDHLGSVREMVDGSGTVQARYDYDAFGRQVKLSGALDADFGYAGYYVNRSTSLDLTWFRAYDPEKGRWLSRDPLDEKIGPKLYLSGKADSNLYRYVWNNSLRWIDARGLGALDPTLPSESEGAAEAGPEFAEDWPKSPKDPLKYPTNQPPPEKPCPPKLDVDCETKIRACLDVCKTKTSLAAKAVCYAGCAALAIGCALGL